MIRPFTMVCFVLACGSGLYLYQAKHRVQVLDHEIEKTVRATEELRENIRVLHAEWTLQNDPQRLQVLADQFLALKTVAPGQFTSLAELDSRLPPVPQPEAPAASPDSPSTPVADAPTQAEPPPPRVPAVASKPVPPPSAPAPKPAVVAATTPPARPLEPEHEHRAAPPPARPAVVEARAAVAVSPRPVLATASHTVLPPVSTVMTGSALGMARSASLALPRPVPVSSSQWVSNGGGGG
jgi:hypothetical protein